MNARISCTCSHKVRDGKIYTSAMVCDNTSYCARLNPTNSGELVFEALFVFYFLFCACPCHGGSLVQDL